MMRRFQLFAGLALAVLLSSCATPRRPQVFHTGGDTALVVKSLDGRFSQAVAPITIPRMENAKMLERIKTLGVPKTVVIILENYTEPQLGREFRDRVMDWFMEFRQLGCQRIVFLQGKGVADPDGLVVLAEYD
jgi:hypothetical protein